jgi:hypothetical protein
MKKTRIKAKAEIKILLVSVKRQEESRVQNFRKSNRGGLGVSPRVATKV